jgi:hypothetical protein
MDIVDSHVFAALLSKAHAEFLGRVGHRSSANSTARFLAKARRERHIDQPENMQKV